MSRRAPPPPLPEMQALVAAARPDLGDDGAAALAGALRAVTDWPLLRSLAYVHGLVPLLDRHLRAGPAADAAPAPEREALAAQARLTAMRHVVLARALREIVQALDRDGVIALAHKGPSLAALLYRPPWLRVSGDLDFFVRPSDLDAARRALVHLGFEPVTRVPRGWEAAFRRARCEFAFHRARDGIDVELHWGLLPRYYAVPVDAEAFWIERTSVDVDGVAVPALGPEDLLYTLALHGTSHLWIRLGWVTDVAVFLRRFERIPPERLLARAERAGALRFFLVGLELARRLLDAPLCPLFQQALRHEPGSVRLAGELAARLLSGARGDPPLGERVRWLVRAHERGSGGARYLARLALEPNEEDWDFVALPPWMRWAYPPVKIARLLAARRRARPASPAAGPNHD